MKPLSRFGFLKALLDGGGIHDRPIDDPELLELRSLCRQYQDVARDIHDVPLEQWFRGVEDSVELALRSRRRG